MTLDEGNLTFDFSGCNPIKPVFRFDSAAENAYGLKAVDFEAETDDSLIFVEVKDFQHPNATEKRRKADFKMLVEAATRGNATFHMEMGQKIKDSLLRKYAQGERITKNVVYLLLLNADGFSAAERMRLKEKIGGHVPTGLNSTRFSEFTSITFEMANIEHLKSFGITCTAKN